MTRTPRPAAGSTTRRALSPYNRANRFLVFLNPIPEIVELNIGHSIVARAALVGMDRAVRDMIALLRR